MQPEKAQLPIAVTEFGIIVFMQPAIRVLLSVSIIALQLSRESYFVLLLSITIDDKSRQKENIYLPIEFTELGMVTDVKPVQL